MTDILGLNGRPLKPRKAKQGNDLASVNDCINIAHNVVGPLAVVLQQMMEKVARCEDRLGITDETVAQETERPRGTPLGPVEGCEALSPLATDDPAFQVGPQFNAVAQRSPLAGGDVE